MEHFCLLKKSVVVTPDLAQLLRKLHTKRKKNTRKMNQTKNNQLVYDIHNIDESQVCNTEVKVVRALPTKQEKQLQKKRQLHVYQPQHFLDHSTNYIKAVGSVHCLCEASLSYELSMSIQHTHTHTHTNTQLTPVQMLFDCSMMHF